MLGNRSKRLKDGRVYVDRASPRDIVLTGLRSDPRRFKRRFDYGLDDDVEDEEDYGLDFIDDIDDDEPRYRRARSGSLGTPVINSLGVDDLDDDLDTSNLLRGPNSKRAGSGEITLNINIYRK